MNDYDVVVMNPPYGQTLDRAKNYLKSAYPLTGNDLYSAFFERATNLARGGGFRCSVDIPYIFE